MGDYEEEERNEGEAQPVVTMVEPYVDSSDDEHGGHDSDQGILMDMGMHSPFSSGRKKMKTWCFRGAPAETTTKKLLEDRKEKDIRFKLKAWWYRFSYVQRWHDAFRREHHKIPSRVDVGKDPDLVRNQTRLDQRTVS